MEIAAERPRLTAGAGLTHDRFMGLLRSWSAFLDGAEARKQTNHRRPGADDDTWAAQQKRISSFKHYQIDGALRLLPCWTKY